MIPFIFDKYETSFSTNGLGALRDCISCEITQERNTVPELVLEYPFSGANSESILMRRIILALPDKLTQPQPFRIYEIQRTLDGNIVVYARHIAYDLVGYVMEPFSATSSAGAFEQMSAQGISPFVLRSTVDNSGSVAFATPISAYSALLGTEGSILDVYGGEYMFHHFNVDLMERRGVNRGAFVRHGQNLMDFEIKQNAERQYRAVYPFWADADGNLVQLDADSEGNRTIPTGNNYFTSVLALDLSEKFETMPTETQLRNAAQNYISSNNLDSDEISVDIDVFQFKGSGIDIGLCDTVNVVLPYYDIVSEAKCIGIEFDSLTEEYKKITLGTVRKNFTNVIASQEHMARRNSVDIARIKSIL